MFLDAEKPVSTLVTSLDVYVTSTLPKQRLMNAIAPFTRSSKIASRGTTASAARMIRCCIPRFYHKGFSNCLDYAFLGADFVFAIALFRVVFNVVDDLGSNISTSHFFNTF